MTLAPGLPDITLIGAGAMGSMHARVIAQSSVANLATVIDPREDVGRSLAARYGASWAPTIDGVGSVHGVVIAAATEAHHELAQHLLQHDLPLLIEKPVSDDLQRTLDILKLSSARRIPIMCGLLERFNPAILTARTLVDAPVHVTATRHSPYAPRIRTGVAWDLLIHDVDLALQVIASEPASVSGSVAQFHEASASGAEDVAEVLIDFAGGQLAQISASRIGQRKERFLNIYELDRLIEVDLLRRDVTLYRHVSGQAADDDGRGYRQQTVIEIPELTTGVEPLLAQLTHFVSLLEGRIDQDDERASIVPSHEIVAQLKQIAAREKPVPLDIAQ